MCGLLSQQPARTACGVQTESPPTGAAEIDEARTAFERFDVAHASCDENSETQKLLTCIEVGFGSYEPFNALVRQTFVERAAKRTWKATRHLRVRSSLAQGAARILRGIGVVFPVTNALDRDTPCSEPSRNPAAGLKLQSPRNCPRRSRATVALPSLLPAKERPHSVRRLRTSGESARESGPLSCQPSVAAASPGTVPALPCDSSPSPRLTERGAMMLSKEVALCALTRALAPGGAGSSACDHRRAAVHPAEADADIGPQGQLDGSRRASKSAARPRGEARELQC